MATEPASNSSVPKSDLPRKARRQVNQRPTGTSTRTTKKQPLPFSRIIFAEIHKKRTEPPLFTPSPDFKSVAHESGRKVPNRVDRAFSSQKGKQEETRRSKGGERWWRSPRDSWYYYLRQIGEAPPDHLRSFHLEFFGVPDLCVCVVVLARAGQG